MFHQRWCKVSNQKHEDRAKTSRKIMQIVIVIFDLTVLDKKKHLVITFSSSLLWYWRKASRKREDQWIIPVVEFYKEWWCQSPVELSVTFILHNILVSLSVCWLKPFSLLVLKMLSSGGKSPTKVTQNMSLTVKRYFNHKTWLSSQTFKGSR